MRNELFEALNKVRVRGQRLRLSVADGDEGSGKAPNTRDAKRDGTRPERKFGDKKSGDRKGALEGSKSGKHRKGGNDAAGNKVKPKRKKDRHRNRGKRP